MTAPTEPGSTVARRSPLALTPQQEAMIAERKLQSAMVQKIRGATWSQQWDAHTIAAVATWARQHDVDPITEIDVLGGNIYLRARHYERVLSRLIAAGQIDYARKDWVHIDARLEKLATQGSRDAVAEAERRTMARIRYNLSDKADAACVYRIKHRRMAEEVTGAKEHVPGKRKDPVGDAMPMETVETRALHRAMLQLAAALPDLSLSTTNDEDYMEVGEIVQENHDRLKATRQQRSPSDDGIQTVVIRGDTPAAPDDERDEDDRWIETHDTETARHRQDGLGLEETDRPRRARNAVAEGR